MQYFTRNIAISMVSVSVALTSLPAIAEGIQPQERKQLERLNDLGCPALKKRLREANAARDLNRKQLNAERSKQKAVSKDMRALNEEADDLKTKLKAADTKAEKTALRAEVKENKRLLRLGTGLARDAARSTSALERDIKASDRKISKIIQQQSAKRCK